MFQFLKHHVFIFHTLEKSGSEIQRKRNESHAFETRGQEDEVDLIQHQRTLNGARSAESEKLVRVSEHLVAMEKAFGISMKKPSKKMKLCRKLLL